MGKKKKRPVTFQAFINGWDSYIKDDKDYSIPFIFNALDGKTGYMYFKTCIAETDEQNYSQLLCVTDIFFTFDDMDEPKHLTVRGMDTFVSTVSTIPSVKDRISCEDYVNRSVNLFGHFNPYELTFLLADMLPNESYVTLYCKAIRYVQRFLVSHQYSDWMNDPVDDGTLRMCMNCGEPVSFNSHFHAYICNNCFWESPIV